MTVKWERERDESSELIVQSAFEESPGELSSKNPMVLSCGGIYIPRSKRGRLAAPLWKIINLADTKNPTKVVSSALPKSPLSEILKKESLN